MLQEEVSEIVTRDEGQILKKAKIKELEFGFRPGFTRIGQYRSDNYAQLKNNQNPLAGYGNVDLIRTGAFANSLFPVGIKTFIFQSGNDKAGDLINKYGKDIMGLSQSTFYQLQKEVYAPKLIEFIKNKLGQ